MGQVPRELTPLESALDFFGAQLRHWRTLRTLSQVALGQRIHDSGALIGKIEKGERFPSRALIRRLDAALETGGALERLWPQVEQERATHDVAGDRPAVGDESVPGDLGLGWPATPDATVEVVAQLWRADMDRRSALASAAWIAAAFAGPIREWLLNRQDEIRHDRSGRRVGQHDVDALWAMCDAFAVADYRLGGGYGRSTLLHYVNQVVLPLLKGSYNDTIGRELMAATARLCDLCAWMSFDSGRQGLAQRYYIQGLRLAQASGNRGLGAHILNVNHPHTAARAEYKPLQQTVAAQAGLTMPATLISNDHAAAAEFAQTVTGPVVCKPLSSLALGDQSGAPLITYTTAVTVDDIDPEAFAAGAHCLQAWVDKACDARVTMVGHRPYGVAIHADSPAAHVDWRADYGALRYSPIQPPAEVTAAMGRYLDLFGLSFGAFDFGITRDGQWLAYELNPNGQWAWIEEETGLPISSALADALEGRCRR